jgi:4-amino-4-deoxy-L-arabinose transferase-like glycosyltransferase
MRQSSRQLVWIFVIGLLLRFAVGFIFYSDRMDPARHHYRFDYEIGTIASAVAAGHGFSDPYPYYGPSGPSALIPPVYPYVLGYIFKMFGSFSLASFLIALFLNCATSALTALPIRRIGAKCFGERVGRWSAWTWMLFPYSIYWGAVFPWTTVLTAFLLALLILCAIELESNPRVALWFAFGLLGGFGALNDPVVVIVLPLLVAWPCYRLATAAHRQAWKLPAIAALIGMAIVPAPWLARNYRVFHRPVFIRDTFWVAFRIGNSGNTLHWEDDNAVPSHNPAELAEMAQLGEPAYMDAKKVQSLAFLRAHPGLFLELDVRRFVYFWTGFWSFGAKYLEMEPADPYNIPFSVFLFALTLLGLWKMFREKNERRWLFALIFLFFPAIYYFTDPLLRHRHPLDPETVMLSLYVLLPRIDAWRARRGSAQLVAASHS